MSLTTHGHVGVSRQVERVRQTETSARNALREACRDRGRTDAADTITPETKVAGLWARLLADEQACDWDLPEFVDMVMATGLRIGETSAITWPAVDLDAGTVEMRGTVIRMAGSGPIIKWSRSRAQARAWSSCRPGRCRCS